MAGARSHDELVCWQLARTLKIEVYAILESGALAQHPDLCDQLYRSASNAPRNIAEGFGRYLPNDFIRYLRFAVGEVKETLDAIQDGVDRGALDGDTELRIMRLCKRTNKAIANFIKYLKTANAPGEPPRRPPRRRRRPRPEKAP